MEKLITEGKYSHFQYEIWANPPDDNDKKSYFYKILDKGGSSHYWLNDPVIREADENFDTEQEATFAAIGHIDLLESGEG